MEDTLQRHDGHYSEVQRCRGLRSSFAINTMPQPDFERCPDSRGNLKRIHQRFQDEHDGLHLRVGCEPEMLWLKPGDDKAAYYETTKPYAYHIDQFEQLTDVWLRVYD